MGFYELDTMGTGRVMLVVIPNCKRNTLEREIRERVASGGLIWTDSVSSYNWFEKAGSGYTWDCVNHLLRMHLQSTYANTC